MKIIVSFKSVLSAREVRKITNKHNLQYKEHDVDKSLNIHAKATQGSAGRSSHGIEIDGKNLMNVSSEAVYKSLPQKGFVESVDKKSIETLFVDEEQEVMRSKTIRFF